VDHVGHLDGLRRALVGGAPRGVGGVLVVAGDAVLDLFAPAAVERQVAVAGVAQIAIDPGFARRRLSAADDGVGDRVATDLATSCPAATP
jgi:hypothetical protein